MERKRLLVPAASQQRWMPACTSSCFFILCSISGFCQTVQLQESAEWSGEKKHLQSPHWSQLGNDTTAPVPKWKAGPWSFWGRKWRTIQAVISRSLSCGAAANNSKMIKNSFLNHVSALMSDSNCTTHQSPAQQANLPQTSDVLEVIKRC